MRLNLINGNDKPYITKDITICIVSSHMDNLYLEHIKKYTGMVFEKQFDFYRCKPVNAVQVMKLLTLASTFCFEVCYSDNENVVATMYLRFREREPKIKDSDRISLTTK